VSLRRFYRFHHKPLFFQNGSCIFVFSRRCFFAALLLLPHYFLIIRKEACSTYALVESVSRACSPNYTYHIHYTTLMHTCKTCFFLKRNGLLGGNWMGMARWMGSTAQEETIRWPLPMMTGWGVHLYIPLLG
ncbi:hypothetical protein CI102_12730, partial [Trichoderma harzianum]